MKGTVGARASSGTKPRAISAPERRMERVQMRRGRRVGKEDR